MILMVFIILEYLDTLEFTDLRLVINPKTQKPLLFDELKTATNYAKLNCPNYKIFPLVTDWDWVKENYCWKCDRPAPPY